MYQIHRLKKFPKLFHAFSTKEEGNMANIIFGEVFNREKVLKNRINFFRKIGIQAEDVVVMRVVGEDGIQVVNKDYAGVGLSDPNFAVTADALITAEKGLYLMLLVADCAPVIIYDTKKGVLALAHVGWRGADLDIIGKVIKKFRKFYAVDTRNLIAAIGPAARRNSYIKQNPSQIGDPKWVGFIHRVSKKNLPVFLEKSHTEGDGEFYKVDFVGLCKRQLLENGVEERNVFDCKIDTVRDKRFFSHMREGKLPISRQGRFACVVGLK